MSDAGSAPVGTIGWIDLTVEDAGALRRFYGEVAGWEAEPVDMGGYEDFDMVPAGGEGPVAGICHARGANAGIPPTWLVYITVDDLSRAMAACEEGGGEVVVPARRGDWGAYCVIRDPAGAVAALFEAPV